MGDLKPPRAEGDERSVLCSLLQYQRESLVRKLEGVNDEAARWSPVGSGTSLLWLARHVARAEVVWVLVRFEGRSVRIPEDDFGPEDTLAAAIAAYRQTWVDVDAVVAGAHFDARCQEVDSGSLPTLRWVVAHLLEETARHAGHADILRELIDGQTGR